MLGLITVALVALTLGTGCTRAATQLVVVVDSDLEVANRVCLRVTVSRVGTSDAPSETFFHATGDREPRGVVAFSFGIAPPDGDASRRVEMVIDAIGDAASCSSGVVAVGDITLTRRVRTGFLPHQSLRLPVFLASACLAGPMCGPDEACGDDGTCVPVDVDPSALRSVRPGEEFEDAGRRDGAIPVDAFVASDAGPVTTDFASSLPDLATHAITQVDPVYPVGVDGDDHVLVAGLSTMGGMVGSTGIYAAR